MNQAQDLNDVFDRCYQSIVDLVSQRQAVRDYDWIIESGGDSFYPDYFTIQSMGRSIFE